MFTVQTYRKDKKLGINILNSIYNCTRAFEWGNPAEVYKYKFCAFTTNLEIQERLSICTIYKEINKISQKYTKKPLT